MATVRAHVLLPGELLRELDILVGKRKRSAFVEAAIREKLRRERQADALRNPLASIGDGGPPEWSTPAGVSAWVRDLRSLDHSREEPGPPGSAGS